MNILEIEDLISKYWNCETSEKEEVWLKDFFSQGEVPVELKKYQPLFFFHKQQSALSLSDDFDEKVLSLIKNTNKLENKQEQKVIKKRSIKLSFFDKITKVAAIAFIAVIAGLSIYTLEHNLHKVPIAYNITYEDIKEASPIARLAIMSLCANYTEGEKTTKDAMSKSMSLFVEYAKF